MDLTGGYRKGIALFIANLYLRNIRQKAVAIGQRQQLLAMLEEAFSETSDDYVDLVGKKSGEVIRFSREEFDLSRRESMDPDRRFVDFIESTTGEVAELLLDRRWNVLVSTNDWFITSDNPVILNGPKHSSFGFGSEEATVYFPLTPGKLLMIDSRDGPENNYSKMQPRKGDVVPSESGFNFQAYGNAYRFAFGPRDLYEVLEDSIKFCDNLAFADPNGPYYALRKPDGSVERLGRNAPCYCGSGKKYKRCHKPLEEELVDFNPDKDWMVNERRDLEFECEPNQW